MKQPTRTSTRDRAMLALALARSANGIPGGPQPAPGTPAYNPAWYALTDVYLDPVAGSDSAAGSSPSTAVKTMAEVVRRYGSTRPALPFGQNLTIHQLTAQTAGFDAFLFDPNMSAGGSFAWKASATLVGTAFSPTTVTAKLQTAAGHDWSMTGALPAGIAQGQIVRNLTKHSSAMVATVLAGVATLTQPVTDASLDAPNGYAEDNTWSNADTYQLSSGLLCNWQSPSVGGPGSGNYQIDSIIPSYQGAGGFEDLIITPRSGALRFTRCFFPSSPGAVIPVLVNSLGTIQLACCAVASACVVGGASTQLFCLMYGVWFGGGIEAGSGCVLDGDTIVDTFCQLGQGNVILVNVHFTAASAPATLGGTFIVQETFFPSVTTVVWGGATLNVAQGAEYFNASGSSFATVLKLAGLQLDGVGTGSSFNAAAAGNPYTAGVAITSANIDTGGGAGNPGLQNPRTGSRYAST